MDGQRTYRPIIITLSTFALPTITEPKMNPISASRNVPTRPKRCVTISAPSEPTNPPIVKIVVAKPNWVSCSVSAWAIGGKGKDNTDRERETTCQAELPCEIARIGACEGVLDAVEGGEMEAVEEGMEDRPDHGEEGGAGGHAGYIYIFTMEER